MRTVHTRVCCHFLFALHPFLLVTMSGIADMWNRIMGKGAQEISLPLDDVYRKSDRRRVVIDGTQVNTIIAALGCDCARALTCS